MKLSTSNSRFKGKTMRDSIKVILFCFLLVIPFLTLACSQIKDYPTDLEQLSEDERLVIRFSHVVGEDTPKGMAARKFAELIKERSNGRIEIQVFSNGTLYKDVEELDALLRGDIQLIAPAISKLTDLVPELSVYDLPYAFNSLEEVHEFTESEAGNRLKDLLKMHNLIALGLWDSGFKQISNDIRPIEHYQDLKGIRMRIMQSDILAQQYYIVDAFPRKIDFNTVFQSLKKGDIEGQENTLTNITSKNFYSLQKYLTISNHGYLGYFLLFNLDFWESLSDEDQELITETLHEVQEWQWQLAEDLNDKRLQEIEECQCIQIYYLSEEEKKEWEEHFTPVYHYYTQHYGDYYIQNLPKYKYVK